MIASYKKLFKLLIDKGIRKTELLHLAQISPTILARLGRDENVMMDTLVKICTALNCNIDDIVELVPDEKKNE